MPVRSLNSSILRWPDADQVHQAASAWAQRVRADIPGVEKVGYVGSYARGNWGVGSDLDLVVLVDSEEAREELRLVDRTGLPVPAELRVYLVTEWDALKRPQSSRAA